MYGMLWLLTQGETRRTSVCATSPSSYLASLPPSSCLAAIEEFVVVDRPLRGSDERDALAAKLAR